jgi:hypothetical protein
MGSKEKFSGQGEPEGLPHKPQSGSNRPVIRPDNSVDKDQLSQEIRRSASDPSLWPHPPGKFAVREPIDVDRLSDDGKKLLEVLEREAGDWDLLPIYAEKLEFDVDKATQELDEQRVVDRDDIRLKLKQTWIGRYS